MKDNTGGAGLQLLFAGLPMAVFSNVFLGGLLVAVLWPVANPVLAAAWLALLALAQAGRLLLWIRYRRAGKAAEIHASLWLQGFRIGAIGSGALWGAGVWLLFPSAGYVQQVFMAFVLAGLSAGAVTSLAPDRASVLGFLTLALLPLILGFLRQDSGESLAMSAMILLFLAYAIIAGARQRDTLIENSTIRRGQNAMREMLNEAAARLLASRAQNLDEAIDHSLSLAGEHLGAGRAYLFWSSGTGEQMSNTHEWCAPGVAPQKDLLQDLPLAAFHWWWEQMKHGDMILVADVSQMPPAAATEQALLESQDICAMCAFPIQRDNVTLGFIGFDQVGETREWEELEIRLLGLLAGLIGSALLRAEGEMELLEAQQLASLGHWTANLATGELSWSDEIFRIFGHAPGSFVPSVAAFHSAVHPEDRQLLQDSAALTGQYDVVHRIVRPDGSIRVVHELARMQLDEAGKPRRMTGTVQDITERTEAEQKIAATKARLEFATQTANLGMWEYDLIEDHLIWNQQMHVLTGLPPESFAGNYAVWDALLYPEDRARTASMVEEMRRKAASRLPLQDGQLALTGHTALDSLYRIQRHDSGETRWMRGLGTTLVDGDQVPCRMVGVTLDVSELIQAREEAERANRAKSEFLSSMSHELRTPLNAILGFSQLLQFEDLAPEERRDNVQEVLTAGNHLLTLINEVLDLAQIESGRLALALDTVQLGPVLEECLSLVQVAAQRRGIQISHLVVQQESVRADRQRLKQALLNLLSNAIKYNREGGSVELQAQPTADGRLRILVKDTGQGIDPARQAELFQPFSRLGAEAGPIEGTGIGLNVTRRIVEAMGGTVGAESARGVGSTFWIELPRAVAVAAGVTRTGAAPQP